MGDLRVSVNSLVQNGAVLPHEDLQRNTETLAKQKVLKQLRSEPDTFGLKSELLTHLHGSRTLVEFSSPNVAKKFHAGHLRSTFIGRCESAVKQFSFSQSDIPGNFIANVKKAVGKEVIRVNFGGLGDAVRSFGAGFERFGCQQKLRDQALQHLFEVSRCSCHAVTRLFSLNLSSSVQVYVQVNREAEHDDNRLGVHFDHFSGESFYHSETKNVLEDLKSRGLLKTTQKGTTVVDLSDAGDLSSYATLARSDGTSLYITRDIAAALDRHQRFGFDEMIYVLQKLLRIQKKRRENWDQCCCDTGPLISDYRFEWDTALQAQGDTGVFCSTHTHDSAVCFVISLLNRFGDEMMCGDLSPLTDNRSVSILQHLLRYDEILLQSATDLQPRHLVNFLMTLCHLVSSAHRELPVKGSSLEVAQARLCLFSAARSLLANGMRILGITPVDKM
ncbi:putative arginine--tRNA ligase, mitochondrial [Triplophysa tibetana]|uniref:Probable arginine--tRNA ligase, mitochondrial n=1 Tax=Triplophysa tibetana TaxID=1572043 RepID=A0A5A9NI40_9TELE|nr:putative arginine--tRNA ligase, mitochondrial [Triplophysa tibetana]